MWIESGGVPQAKTRSLVRNPKIATTQLHYTLAMTADEQRDVDKAFALGFQLQETKDALLEENKALRRRIRALEDLIAGEK